VRAPASSAPHRTLTVLSPFTETAETDTWPDREMVSPGLGERTVTEGGVGVAGTVGKSKSKQPRDASRLAVGDVEGKNARPM